MGYKVGIDVGSTTIKAVVLNENNAILYKKYQRHYSKIAESLEGIIKDMVLLLKNKNFKLAVSGSAGLGISKACNLDFVQEVFALGGAVDLLVPDTDAVVELGGEDAKIVFLTGGFEERMNGTCAGGTGAFIDQMATLLDVSVPELDELALNYKKIYDIASRCGVFAKTDIQPLINQGARKEDIAASIYQAVVEQTIAGLAQGRKIEGKVLFLGGPLFFLKGLQKRFVETLKLSAENAVFPDLGQYFVAIGTALYAEETNKTYDFESMVQALGDIKKAKSNNRYLEPLFKDRAEYDAFVQRHNQDNIESRDIKEYSGRAYLGIDVGSTTSKVALLSADNELLYTFYASNKGNPLGVIKKQLETILELCGSRIEIVSSAVTGYGEELIKNAFSIDYGVVETVAHFTAARFFNPQVDYIIDIGGQDMKCFKIRNNTIDSIVLNEACSSGCGSFVQSFAEAMGYDLPSFTKLGIFAEHPVDLGSRCTVFMNSSVKQAQRDGAEIGDVAAGLAISVIKNAIYKVLRVNDPAELGKNIVVQGGTFLNDAILRSFERELGIDVIRPGIAGLMGAFGAALYSRSQHEKRGKTATDMLSFEEIKNFKHQSKAVVCGGCTNKCNLTVNTFPNGVKYISGNKCERGVGAKINDLPNVFDYVVNKVRDVMTAAEREREAHPERPLVGIPVVLNMWENLPYWDAFFKEIGCNILYSGESSRKLYSEGQFTIPSDTVCYPAKLVHGHISRLLNQKDNLKCIFYPCMSYNFDEKRGDNNYNCPVVAYYPELLASNIAGLQGDIFLYPYISLNDDALFIAKTAKFWKKHFGVNKKQVVKAVAAAREAYAAWKKDIKDYGMRSLEYAVNNGKKVVVLAGRPYHADREVNHSIDKMFNSLGFVVLSERVVCDILEPQKVNVLNQWTYHARMYNAARFVSSRENMELVQLVSFGCGLDAVTSDEVKDILERNGKIYTQLKIDEINNLAAVKIRARSLLAAMEEREGI
ncbi:MAG: acyl-CoA dehydratase activase [Bacillota bacterium]